MRICHVITRFIRGGADENTLLSCNAQAAAGHDVWLVHGGQWHPSMVAQLDPRVQRICVSDLVREIAPARDIRAQRRCLELFREIRPDVVHTHTSKAGIIGRVAAVATNVPSIVHGVHIIPWLNVTRVQAAIYLAAERAMAPFTDAFIDVADEIRGVCLDARVGDHDRHHVVHSGMDIGRFRGAVGVDWRTLIAPEKLATTTPKFLVHVSALEPRKRQTEFLPVFAEVSRRYPNAVLLFVGDGPDRPLLERKIAELGLQGRALCVGHQSQVETWIALATACLLTSLREGLARVLVQYALVGRPIVATDIPGCRTIVREGVNGYLVAAENLRGMVAPLERILHDDRLAASLGHGNDEIDLDAWSAERMALAIDDVYRCAAARPHWRLRERTR